MKKISITGILLIIFAIRLFTSCSTEFDAGYTPPSSPTDDPASLVASIKLNTPNSFATSTRSLSESQENAINDVCILAFKAGVLSYIKKSDVIENNELVKVSLKSSTNSADTYKLVVLANAYELLKPIAGNDLIGLNGLTYNEIQDILNKTGINEVMYPSGGSIVMWGELPYQEIKSSNNNFSVYLIRAIARIDVGTGAISFNPDNMQATWGGLSNFTLEGVYIYKPNNAYSFIPLVSNFDDTNKKVTQPSPIGTRLTSPLYYTVTGGISIVRSIYVPEADVKMGTQGTSGDNNHMNRMAVIVKGSYNGNASSYYRLDLINSEKALTNVLRNHLYQLNIKSVSGNGYTNPDDAYKSFSENMEVEVLEWNDGAIGEIVFDNQYMLGVNKGQFALTDEEQTATDTDNKLTITTDYPSGWKIEKIVDENGDIAGATWITTSLYTGPANAKTTISLLADENTFLTNRKAYIHITAGRLTYIVEVIQAPAKIIPPKTLLTIGSGKDGFGYNFSGTAASNKLITTSANFGTLPNSTVKAEGFIIINGGQNPSESQMLEWLITNPVDIVVLGYDNFNISSTVANYYAQYLQNGGVVLAFQDRIDDGVSKNLLRAVFGSGVTVAYGGTAGSVYKFSNLNNKILNGPFGDIRGTQWGEDASTTVRVSGLNTNLVDILSTDQNISFSSTSTGAATAFKHKTLNFIWVGDGGFNSNNGGADLTACPFKLNASNFPISKPNYGAGTKYPVYNSIFTANALAWALKQAEAQNN